jgi:DnaJ-class molecular chaperone
LDGKLLIKKMPGETKQHYATLQLSSDADREQIATAFRLLAIELHPLRNPKEEKTKFIEKFNKVCEAYEILSNDRLRSVYDRFGDVGLSNGFKTEEE